MGWQYMKTTTENRKCGNVSPPGRFFHIQMTLATVNLVNSVLS